jgi:hypothetical protein
MNITQVGNPIIDDFYTLSGSDIPLDAVIEFTTAGVTRKVNPNFIRPHLALVERLPASIPPGPATVRITSLSTPASNTLSVNVAAGPAPPVRVLHGGEQKQHPYTIVFVGNPAFQNDFPPPHFVADLILNDRRGYQKIVTHCFHSLFMLDEDLLRDGDIDARMRLISLFPPVLPALNENALTQQLADSDLMEPRGTVIRAFLDRFDLTADVVFVIHGSSTHIRAKAQFTTDSDTDGVTAYMFDGDEKKHGHFASIPGSVAIPVSLDVTEPTVLHEFIHAASDFNNGMVIDLFNDEGIEAPFVINKKFRASSNDPVPVNFANYEDTNFLSDPTRNGLNYDPDWCSYHPELIDPTRPNLMDDYRVPGGQQFCRLDRLTLKWLRDRLMVKLSR